MGIFGKILKTTFDIATTPIDVIKDAATMGGVLTDQDESYTSKKFKRLGDDLEETRNELDDL